MQIAITQKAGPHEVFAPDIQLPAPGSAIRIREGGEAILVSASREDETTLRLVLDMPQRVDAILGQAGDLSAFSIESSIKP